MNERLRDLRAAAAAELLGDDTDRADSPKVDELLERFFAETPASDFFEDVADALAQTAAWPDAPPGRSASRIPRWPEKPTRDVLTALGGARRQARGAVSHSLELGDAAADLLLDRPAAVLLTFDPEMVRELAQRCHTAPGPLFADIAVSEQGSRGYVYAYRPGDALSVPARRAIQSNRPSILEWGRRFFGLERRDD